MSEDLKLPAETAGLCVLPDGTKVWVQTLSEEWMHEAQRAAERYAYRQADPIGEGGEDFDQLRRQFERDCPTSERQAAYLAGAERVKLVRAAWDAHPEPPEPVRGEEMEAAAYAKLLKKWEKEKQAATEARDQHVQSAYQARMDAALSLTVEARLARCLETRFAEEVQAAYGRRIWSEILFRACRKASDPDHVQRHFKSVEQVIDLAEPVKAALIAKYGEFWVAAEQIPTSAGG